MSYRNMTTDAHDCEMPPWTDDLLTFIPGTSMFVRLRRSFRRSCFISAKTPASKRCFRSSAAIHFERTKHLYTNYYKIHPFGDFRRWWEMYMCVVFAVSLYIVPFDAAYSYRHTYFIGFWIWADLLTDLACLSDIVVKFFTGYYDKNAGKTVLDTKLIAVKYLKSFFLIDIVSSLPIDNVMRMLNMKNLPIMRFFAFLKIFRIVSLRNYLKHSAEYFGMSYIVMAITLRIIEALIVVHWAACIQYTVADVSGSEDAWIRVNDLDYQHNWNKYVYSLFRASSTLMNVQYGISAPKTVPDQMITNFLSLFGKVYFVLYIREAVSWSNCVNVSADKYGEMIRELYIYMHRKKLPLFLQNRIVNYYEFRFQKSYFQEVEILSTLSAQLRQEIVLFHCQRLVENVPFFHNMPVALLVKIVTCLHAEYFLVNDVIVKAAAVGDCMYFIMCGTVAVYTSTGKEVCHLEDGAHFGEIALVMEDELRVASVVAVESCELYRLNRNDFRRAVSPYPDLLARIERIATDRLEKTMIMEDQARRLLKQSIRINGRRPNIYFKL